MGELPINPSYQEGVLSGEYTDEEKQIINKYPSSEKMETINKLEDNIAYTEEDLAETELKIEAIKKQLKDVETPKSTNKPKKETPLRTTDGSYLH